jgi:hypothetical protein
VTITVSVPVAANAVAPGSALPAGPQGANQYQLAVMRGFKGTLDEWLAAQIGPAGRGIARAILDSGVLTLVLTDGTKVDLGSIIGPPGTTSAEGLADVVEALKRVLIAPDVASARSSLGAAALGHTPVLDADHQVSALDVDVAFTVLTGPRIVTLCDVDNYPLGQDLVIGDETGACSAAMPITIVPGAGTDDAIPQSSDGTIVLNSPFASVRLRRGATNIWKIVA